MINITYIFPFQHQNSSCKQDCDRWETCKFPELIEYMSLSFSNACFLQSNVWVSRWIIDLVREGLNNNKHELGRSSQRDVKHNVLGRSSRRGLTKNALGRSSQRGVKQTKHRDCLKPLSDWMYPNILYIYIHICVFLSKSNVWVRRLNLTSGPTFGFSFVFWRPWTVQKGPAAAICRRNFLRCSFESDRMLRFYVQKTE